MCCALIVVRRLLLSVACGRLLFVMCCVCPLSVVNCLSPVVCCLMFVGCCLLFVAGCVVLVARFSLFDVCN